MAVIVGWAVEVFLLYLTPVGGGRCNLSVLGVCYQTKCFSQRVEAQLVSALTTRPLNDNNIIPLREALDQPLG